MVKRIGMRRLAAFAAAAALVLCLVGCGGAQSTAQGNTEPVNLSVWTYYNGDQLESFNKLVETFNDRVGKEKNSTGVRSGQGSDSEMRPSRPKTPLSPPRSAPPRGTATCPRATSTTAAASRSSRWQSPRSFCS